MGGDIEVESRVGKGSVFRLDLPVGIGHAPAIGRPAPRGRVMGMVGAERRVRVLLVGSDHDNRSWMLRLLEQVGFDVREENDGADALARFQEWRPHLVLMDVDTPGAGTATRAIRALPGRPPRRPRGPHLEHLGRGGRRPHRGRRHGVLHKPCREGDLLEEIRSSSASSTPTPSPPPPERTSQVPDLLAMRHNHVRRLPAAVVTELRAAAHVADYNQFKEVLTRIPAESAGVAEALRELVEQYAYEQIEAVLEG